MKTARQKQISLKRSRNPFNHGSPVKGEEFFGRQEILDNILLFLTKENEYNFTVFGQRRIGKTSLLRKIQDIANKVNHTYPVYFNLQDKARTQLPQLLFEIAKQIAVALELKLKIKENDFKDSHASFNFKERFIPLVFKDFRSGKGQLLLLFDEFDVLGEIEDIEGDSIVGAFAYKTFIPFMVSLLEEVKLKKYPLKIIFAVGRNYKDLDRHRFGQITKFDPQQEISNFSLEETKYLLKKLSDDIIPFEEEAINEMYMLTSGHPYFTQCLAASSFDNAEKNKKKSISRKIVREEFIPTVKKFASGVLWVWDSLSANDQVILYLMAVLKEENLPINRATIEKKAFSLDLAPAVEKFPGTITRLRNFSFIKESNNDGSVYDFSVEFIRQWIINEITIEEISKKIISLDEDIAFHLNNARYYFNHKNYNQAIGHYEQILEKSPYQFEALFYLARCYKDRMAEDTTYLDKALDLFKKFFELNRDKARKEYLEMLYEKLDHLEAEDRANVWRGKKGKAIEEILKEIQNVNPGDSKVTERLNDLDIIKQLEKEIGTSLTQFDPEKIEGIF
ncbi:MAG: hypothetical protein QG657_2144, partial [Acidobacteriota bacterium]|nr:hypothetical protein [Acidobacteriota bacterium]